MTSQRDLVCHSFNPWIFYEVAASVITCRYSWKFSASPFTSLLRCSHVPIKWYPDSDALLEIEWCYNWELNFNSLSYAYDSIHGWRMKKKETRNNWPFMGIYLYLIGSRLPIPTYSIWWWKWAPEKRSKIRGSDMTSGECSFSFPKFYFLFYSKRTALVNRRAISLEWNSFILFYFLPFSFFPWPMTLSCGWNNQRKHEQKHQQQH